MKRIQKIMAAALIAMLTLSACGSDSGNNDSSNGNNSGEQSQSQVSTASAGGKDTLIVAVGADARVVDPHAAGDSSSVNAVMPVIETLMHYDKDGNLLPLLAESYEQLDGRSWEFKLKEGVMFHNGEELKASDVVYSFKRATSDKGVQVQYILNAVDPDGLEVVDDYTVIIRTKEDFPPFIGYLPYVGCGIINEKAYEADGAEAHPIGTGPFEFVSWDKGDKLTYKRFEGYWGDKPNFENLVIRSIPENNSRLIELETGGADIAINLTVNEMSKIEDNSALELKTAQTTVFTTLQFNCNKAPFNNEKFRQAFDYAIDEEAIVQAVHRGAAIYTPGPVVPHQKYAYLGENECRYDIEKAQQLLEESGINPEDYNLVISVNENQARIDLATIVQSQLKDNLGIEVEINVMETASYWDFIESDEKYMFFTGWGAVGFPDPDNNIYGPLHSSQIPANNTTRFTTPELDEMLDLSRKLPDGVERENLIIDIQKYIREATPYITFDNQTNIIGVRNYVEGFDAMPTSHQYYNWVNLAE